MVLKIGVNGFGRIGRIIFRTCFPNSNIEVSAINDPAIDIEYICYLIKFDSTHGKFNVDITYLNDEIIINGKRVKIFAEKLPSQIPWNTLEIQYVVEASGMFATIEKASGHLANGCVKRVIVTAPSVDIPMMILGVNEEQIKAGGWWTPGYHLVHYCIKYKILSCASSTLYCLAPIIKVLEDNFGVSEGFITSIHAMTPSLKPLDGLCLRGRHWRDHRSIHQNIIPASTGACKALGKIIPQVKDKMCGLAFRVPIINVSVLDITIKLNRNTSLKEIAAKIKVESITKLRNIIKTSYEEAVSSDFLKDGHSCILDVNSSLQLSPTSFKLICWYENEYTYACRVIDAIMFSEEQLNCQESYKNICIRPILQNVHSYCQSKDASDKRYALYNLKCQHNLKIYNTSQGLKKKWHNASDFLNNSFSNNETSQFSDLNIIGSNNPMALNRVSLSTPGNGRNFLRGKKERLELVRKALADVANKAENLLKQSNHDKLQPNIETIERAIISERVNIMKNCDTAEIWAKSENSKAVSSPQISCKQNLLLKPKKYFNQDETKDKEILSNVYRDQEIDINNDAQIHIKNDKSICNHDFINNDTINNKVDLKEISIKFKEPIKEIVDIATNLTNNDKSYDGKHIKADKNACGSSLIQNDSALSKKDFSKLINKDNKEENNETCKHDDVEKETIKSNIIKRRILESILKKITKENISQNSSQFSVDTVSKYSFGKPSRNKLDLIDKLESESDTDSETPSKMYDTKSQVIDITDLTNSREELSRLDKICRIIEISDDLSDQLFSVLNNNSSESRTKKWSFKDLCERIQLDEFCNKVFGLST